MKTILISFFIGGLLLSNLASAQEVVKVGVIDMERILRESSFAKTAVKELEKEFSKREDKLNKDGSILEEELNSLTKQRDAMSETEYSKAKQQFDNAESKFQLEKRIYQDDLAARKREKMQELYEYTDKIIQQFAKQGRYSLVVQDALYFDQKLDITDLILREMDKNK